VWLKLFIKEFSCKETIPRATSANDFLECDSWKTNDVTVDCY